MSNISLTRKTVTAGTAQWVFHEAGEGEALVYLPSDGGLRLSTAHRELAQKYRLIAFELGEGNAATSTAILQALVALGIGKCNLMAHGSGADLALRMVEADAARFTALVLCAPTAISVDATRGNGYFLGKEQPIAPDRLWHGKPAAPATIADAQASDAARQRIAGVATPTLVLLGTRDPVVTTNVGRIYAGTMPKGFASMVYDAGHEVDLDRPEAVASICLNFLANRESYVVNRDDGMINP